MSTTGPLGAFKIWEVQHSVSENHGWVEVPRLLAAAIAGVRSRQAWLLMRGLPLGLVDLVDHCLVEPFRSGATLRPVVDVVPAPPGWAVKKP